MDGKSKSKRSTDKSKKGGAQGNSTPPAQGQLQGSARIVKDHCADWHNYIDKWTGLNDAGFNLISKIINLKLQARTDDASKAKVPASAGTEMDPWTELHDGMPEGLDNLCEQLTDIYTSMVSLRKKMAAITTHFRGVEKLEQRKKSNEEALFFTWPISKFVSSSQTLQDMYGEELEVKRTIVEDVAHHDDRDTMMMYASCWLHQPYIEDQAVLLLEGLLTETGFR